MKVKGAKLKGLRVQAYDSQLPRKCLFNCIDFIVVHLEQMGIPICSFYFLFLKGGDIMNRDKLEKDSKDYTVHNGKKSLNLSFQKSIFDGYVPSEVEKYVDSLNKELESVELNFAKNWKNTIPKLILHNPTSSQGLP